MRLGVYCDFPYRRAGREVWAEQPFVRFLEALRDHVDGLVLLGRVDAEAPPKAYPYRLRGDVELVDLPHYERLSRPPDALRGALGAVRAFDRALAGLDAVWLLGPHPLALVFAAVAALRGRRVILGVRQDLPSYTRWRHPGKRGLLVAALALEAAWRAVGRRASVIAVGPELADKYRSARRLLELTVSLVGASELERPAAERDYGAAIRILSVGRLDPEKNPLMLADVLARLDGSSRRFELIVCGDGSEAGALLARSQTLGVADRVDLRGHVPIDAGLDDLYRSSHLFLHVSYTEGFPQTLIEAFAARLPVVATAVGGVPRLAGDAALLVAPGDPVAAARAVRRVADAAGLRARLTSAGLARARALTREAQSARVAAFVRAEDRTASGEPGAELGVTR